MNNIWVNSFCEFSIIQYLVRWRALSWLPNSTLLVNYFIISSTENFSVNNWVENVN